jgi:hypothetical protein
MTRPVGVFRLAVGNDDGARFLWPTRLAPMTSSGDRLRPNVISTAYLARRMACQRFRRCPV